MLKTSLTENTVSKKNFSRLASACLAGFLATAPLAAGPKIVDGKFCQNNTCKGKSACGGHGNKNGCMGSNECKGKGWLKFATQKSCEENGGKWAAVAKKGMKKGQEKMKDAKGKGHKHMEGHKKMKKKAKEEMPGSGSN